MYKHVRPLIAADWFTVGVKLFEENDIAKLITIKSSGPKDAADACGEMLGFWQEKYSSATWNDFIKALKAPGVKQHLKLKERCHCLRIVCDKYYIYSIIHIYIHMYVVTYVHM